MLFVKGQVVVGVIVGVAGEEVLAGEADVVLDLLRIMVSQGHVMLQY